MEILLTFVTWRNCWGNGTTIRARFRVRRRIVGRLDMGNEMIVLFRRLLRFLGMVGLNPMPRIFRPI
jgi:hypothetical protein